MQREILAERLLGRPFSARFHVSGFCGEYREPSCAVRDPAVQRERLARWLRVCRRGMRSVPAAASVR